MRLPPDWRFTLQLNKGQYNTLLDSCLPETTSSYKQTITRKKEKGERTYQIGPPRTFLEERTGKDGVLFMLEKLFHITKSHWIIPIHNLEDHKAYTYQYYSESRRLNGSGEEPFTELEIHKAKFILKFNPIGTLESLRVEEQ